MSDNDKSDVYAITMLFVTVACLAFLTILSSESCSRSSFYENVNKCRAAGGDFDKCWIEYGGAKYSPKPPEELKK